MTRQRGREGKLKTQYASLYPGLQPGEWLPVETLIRHVTDLIQRDPAKSAGITGPRLLHQDHFEYRGNSARPEGLPEHMTRLSDSGADPDQAGIGGRQPARRPTEKKGPSNG
jgi:hypothetical protein